MVEKLEKVLNLVNVSSETQNSHCVRCIVLLSPKPLSCVLNDLKKTIM